MKMIIVCIIPFSSAKCIIPFKCAFICVTTTNTEPRRFNFSSKVLFAVSVFLMTQTMPPRRCVMGHEVVTQIAQKSLNNPQAQFLIKVKNRQKITFQQRIKNE